MEAQDPPIQVAYAAQDNVLVFLQSGRVSDAFVSVVYPALANPSTAPGAACLSPDGTLLTDRGPSSWRFWHPGEASPSREVPLPADPCGPLLAYSADGQHLLTFGEGPACVVDVQTGDVVARVAASAPSIGWRDGKVIMPFGNQGVTSFDADGQSSITQFEALALPRQEPVAAEEPFDSTVISPAADRVAVHSRGYGFGLYDAQTGALLAAFPTGTAHVFRPVFSLDGAFVLLGDRVVKALDGKVVVETPNLPSGFEAAALANNAKHFALMRKTADGNEAAVLGVHAESGHVVVLGGGHNHPVLSVAVSPDGNQAVTTTGETLLGWSLDHDRIAVAWAANAGRELNARYSADGSLIAVSSDEPKVLTAEGAPVFQPAPVPPSACKVVQTLAFSPDGRWLVRVAFGTIEVFEQGTWNKVAELKSQTCLSSATFSPDSHYLMTSVPELYETETWTQVWTTDVNTEGAPNAYNVAFFPSGREAISSACAFELPNRSLIECFVRTFSAGGRPTGRLDGLSAWPSFSPETEDWLIGAGVILFRRVPRPDALVPLPSDQLSASAFMPNGDILAGTPNGSLLRLCRN